MYFYDNAANTLGLNPIYTSSDASASIYSLTSTSGLGGNVFLFEHRPVPCDPSPCFASYVDALIRTGHGGGSVDGLYTTPSSPFTLINGLTTDGTFLFWHENGAIQRLPNNASALPQINMRVTGIEITQGIQNLSNGVPLIQKRRTFVRVYVKSDGAAVPGVTMKLTGFFNLTHNTLGPLLPVNPAGTSLTVRGSPDRNDINQSFLFELPWNWTTQGPVRLTATLNP